MLQIDEQLLPKLLAPRSTSVLRVFIYIQNQLRQCHDGTKAISINDIAINCRLGRVTVSMCIRILKSSQAFFIKPQRNPNRPNLFSLKPGQGSLPNGVIDDDTEAFNAWLGRLGHEHYRDLRAMYGKALCLMTMRRHFRTYVANNLNKTTFHGVPYGQTSNHR